MDHKQRIHSHIQESADALLAFIQSCESDFPERWVPTIHIKDALALNFVATPQAHSNTGLKGRSLQFLRESSKTKDRWNIRGSAVAHSAGRERRPNNASKPKLHRYAVHMAGQACHVGSYAMQFGLT